MAKGVGRVAAVGDTVWYSAETDVEPYDNYSMLVTTDRIVLQHHTTMSGTLLFSTIEVTRQAFYRSSLSYAIVNLKPIVPGRR
jgi:hypothetical protein